MQGHTTHNQPNNNQLTNHSFIFVLRHGLRNIFRPLFITKIISSRIRPGATLPLPWRSSTYLDFSLGKKSPAKETSKISEMKVNSISEIDHYISDSRRIRVAGISASFILALLTLLTLAPLTSSTNYTEAASSLDDSTTTLTLTTGNTASLAISADSSNGTFATNDSTSAYYTSGSQATSFTVTTNNYTGYTLTLTNSSDNTLVDKSDSSNTLEPLSTAINESTFSTNSTYNNMWGYKPSMLSSSSNSNYLPAPSNTTITMNETHCANSGTNGSYSCPNASDTYTIALGARVNYTQSSGTYTKTFVLTTVANAAQYAISYSDNTGDSTVTGIPTNTLAGTSSETSVTLSSAVPTRTGYTFAGWCEGTVSNNGTTCGGTPGTTYSAGGRFYFDRKTNNATTLYALWTVNSYTITFNGDDGVNNFTVNGSTVAKGGTASLTYNQTYPITINYNDGYEAADSNVLTISSGAGSLSGTTFTVGAGIATLYASSKSSSRPLYDTIAAMSKGKQTAADLKTAITVPTSADRTQDTSNSGVYEYDASVFGQATDAANTHKIYYYRGVLENSVGSYGSDGSAVTYPNYVKLSNNTCWRIVRTTGSGGVKMIYNGTYGATTSGSCANANTKAQVTTNAFGNDYQGYIVDVGYTYNDSIRTGYSSTSVDTVFGSNSNYSVNSSASPMKTYLENTWYSSNMTSYTSKLEPSAGYCNDRVVYSSSSGGTALTSIRPSSTSSATAYFNAYVRMYNSSNKPTLTCARNTVDLYTTSSASNGNKQLFYPVALLTADEAALAGSGAGSSYSANYHANAFLHSGWSFWLLSPSARNSIGSVGGFYVLSDGVLTNSLVSGTIGVRPAVSINPGAEIASGSGTATDPWVLDEANIPDTPPLPSMQDYTASMCQTNASSSPAYVRDVRDDNIYSIRYINGACWMTSNLRYLGDTGSASTSMTMKATTSNIAADRTLAYKDLTTGDNSYTYAEIHVGVDNNNNPTVWYNYVAASAGTITGSSNTTTASYDLCPKNWHLPANGSSTGQIGSVTSYKDAFSPVYGGYYNGGSPIDATMSGSWWSATANNSTSRYRLNYYNGSLVTNSHYRSIGVYVRCVRTT